MNRSYSNPIVASIVRTVSGSGELLESSLGPGRIMQWVSAIAHITARAGTLPLLTLKLETTDDGITFTDLPNGEFAAGISDQTNLPISYSLRVPMITGKYIRANWAITGTLPEWTFWIDFTLSD